MKKPNMLAIAVMVMVLSLALVVSAAADCEPCPPPECSGCCWGCTPGYWKQEHHFDSWPAAYSPDGTYFDDVFGVGPHITLLEALKAQGPGSELLRHGVAALLNEATFPDKYPANDIAQVIWAVQEGRTDLLVSSNEAFCPLN